jgi:hypothetical protein
MVYWRAVVVIPTRSAHHLNASLNAVMTENVSMVCGVGRQERTREVPATPSNQVHGRSCPVLRDLPRDRVSSCPWTSTQQLESGKDELTVRTCTSTSIDTRCLGIHHVQPFAAKVHRDHLALQWPRPYLLPQARLLPQHRIRVSCLTAGQHETDLPGEVV